MHGMRIIGALSASFVAAAALQAGAVVPPAPDSKSRSATATFIDAQGRPIGRATLSQTPKGVLIELRLQGVAPGEHGFHVHETGRCDVQSRFESAGDHYTPQSTQHGFVRGGPHAGDMPNVFADATGKLHADVYTTSVTLRRDAATLFDEDGSALVVHARPDDYHSQPSGGAGDRIACAVIEASPAASSGTPQENRPGKASAKESDQGSPENE